ncbi:amidohydrolase [Ignavigranum ruoffiae]|uniref:Amidohydrolase n=1 Tax=Ignavigranum ruoffiae TaxID=89093 RepID=A0A1H8ZD40_9LACT|nr:M20 family metallopeptidase [Ignavigranum ruoffiae]SEP62319.1 amidohydrolase [Ignavigranum ruoffiae]
MEPHNIQALKDAYQEDLIRWRRDLHQIPELGLELPQTSAYVKQVLTDLGLIYDDHYLQGNGLSVLIEGQKAGEASQKVMGLRADMDGLPIEEATGLAFAANNHCMHACGHDGHTAILLTVAKFLQENRHLFAGKVKLIFQPGEEYPGGAKPMIDQGVLESPQVTRLLGFHIGHLDPSIPAGKISYQVGPFMASMDRFSMTIRGRGYHGAYPENAHDPIIAANHIISAIQTIKSRNLKATEPAVISVTHIEGGVNQNIIPDTVFLEGTVRTINFQQQQFIAQRLQEIGQGTALMFDLDCQVQYDYKYPVLINDQEATEETVAVLSNTLGSDQIVETQAPLMGGEDFAFYGQVVPSCFLFLANPGLIEGSFHGHHHPKFDLDESQLIVAVQAFILATLDYLQ